MLGARTDYFLPSAKFAAAKMMDLRLDQADSNVSFDDEWSTEAYEIEPRSWGVRRG